MKYGIRSIGAIASVCLGCVLFTGQSFPVMAVTDSVREKTITVNEETVKNEEKDFKLTKSTVNLFIGGSTGTKKNGSKAPKARFINIGKYIEGFDGAKYDIKLKSSDKSIASVSSKKDRIYPKKIGQTEVLVSIKNVKTGKIVYRTVVTVNVKKNATVNDLVIDGISDGDYFDCNESVPVTLPAVNDTDIRVLTCEDESVVIKPMKLKNTFMVSFTEPGVFKLKAASYQSESFRGYTAEKYVTVIADKAETEVYQTATDSFKIKGGCVFFDMLPEDVEVYTLVHNTKAFFSSIEKLTVKDDEAEIKMFKNFTPGTEYFVECDGELTSFVAANTGRENIESFSIENTTVQAGKLLPLKIHYYNASGVDITDAVAAELKNYFTFIIDTADTSKGFFSNSGEIYMMDPKLSMKARIKLTIPNEFGSMLDGKKIEKEYTFTSVEAEVPKYTGNFVYSFTGDTDKYLTVNDSTEHILALEDKAYMEALFEFSDGTYRSLNESGVTKVISSDPSVLMVGAKDSNGVYSLITNEVGTAYLLLYAGDEVMEVIPASVSEKRKPTTLHTELSKAKLNTNLYAGDYIILKADVFDQYGKNVEANDFVIEQPEDNIKSMGQVLFGSFSAGRLVINGWDVVNGSNGGYIRATVKSCGLSENIAFSVKDIACDYEKLSEYDYHIKLDGNQYLDTCVLRGKSVPESAFISVVAESDGYFVSEGLGEIFSEKPTMIKKAYEYGIGQGETFYGILVERTDYITGKTETVSSDPCIIPSYMDLEIAPLTYGAKLPEGEYSFTLYLVTGGDPVSQLDIRDKVFINVFDSELEIEAQQLAEEAVVPENTGWEKNIKNYFKFSLDGTDITDCITKVDCNISSNKEVYIKTVTFKIPNTVYGDYERTIELGRLVFMK